METYFLIGNFTIKYTSSSGIHSFSVNDEEANSSVLDVPDEFLPEGMSEDMETYFLMGNFTSKYTSCSGIHSLSVNDEEANSSHDEIHDGMEINDSGQSNNAKEKNH